MQYATLLSWYQQAKPVLNILLFTIPLNAIIPVYPVTGCTDVIIIIRMKNEEISVSLHCGTIEGTYRFFYKGIEETGAKYGAFIIILGIIG